MGLIKTIRIFRKYVKVAFTFNDNAALPNLTLVEQRHIIPITGQAIYDTLNTQITAAALNDPEACEWKTLAHAVCRVIAPLSILNDIALRHLTIGDSGIKKTDSERTENPFRWEFNEVRDQLLNEVSIALDELWQHLYAEGDTYEWSDPNEEKLLIKTAAEFKRFYPLHQPYRIFPLLQPIMSEVEDFFISGSIGEKFFTELKSKADPNENEIEAIKLLKKALAFYTIHKSVERLPVKISPAGFTVKYLDSDNDSLNKGDRHAPDNSLSVVSQSCKRDGRSYMNKLKSFLNKTASDEVFATYKASKYYVAPDTTRTDRNADYNGIFTL